MDDKAIERGAQALWASMNPSATLVFAWDQLHESDRKDWRQHARAVIGAALKE